MVKISQWFTITWFTQYAIIESTNCEQIIICQLLVWTKLQPNCEQSISKQCIILWCHLIMCCYSNKTKNKQYWPKKLCFQQFLCLNFLTCDVRWRGAAILDLTHLSHLMQFLPKWDTKWRPGRSDTVFSWHLQWKIILCGLNWE